VDPAHQVNKGRNFVLICLKIFIFISKKKVAALKREVKKVELSKNDFADWDLIGCEDIANEERDNIMQYADQ